MSPLVERALQIAAREVGVREVGRNRGPRVEEYQAIAGGLPGDPWCAAFVSACFWWASQELGEPTPFMPTMGAQKLWRRALAHQRYVEPEPGRVFVLDHGGGLGHCGFVESIRADSSGVEMVTIEGNTADDGGREGDGVYRRIRRLPSPKLLGFVDYGTTPELVAAGTGKPTIHG